MSVSFARAVADGLRRHGITVHYASGYEHRGNGQSSAYDGCIEHHTASRYDMALPGRGIFGLLRDGRSDLRGPLCNSAGNEDGSVTIIAAHPANHAGASGGSWARPFPDTRNFNRMVWGHEIVYPGNSPMRPAQYRTAQILGGVISGILGRPNPEWVRGHYETSVTGKFDPGYAPGKWISMADFRAGIWGALNSAGAPPAPAPSPAPARRSDEEELTVPAVYPASPGNEITVKHPIPPKGGWLVGKGASAVSLYGGSGRTFIRSIVGVEDWTNNGKADGKRHTLRGAYDLVGRDVLDSGAYGTSTYLEITYSSEAPLTVLFETSG